MGRTGLLKTNPWEFLFFATQSASGWVVPSRLDPRPAHPIRSPDTYRIDPFVVVYSTNTASIRPFTVRKAYS